MLRRFTEADASALFPMMSDAQVNRFLPYAVHGSVADTASYLEENYLRWYRAADADERRSDGLPLDMHCAICRKRGRVEAGELLGFVSIDAEGDAYDMGYAWLAMRRAKASRPRRCERCSVRLAERAIHSSRRRTMSSTRHLVA